MAHFKDYNNVVGDNPMNLSTTVLALNAYMLDHEEKYRNWALEYIDAWVGRTKANGGIIPTNIGLDVDGTNLVSNVVVAGMVASTDDDVMKSSKGYLLYVANAPSYDHQFTVREITFHLQSFVREQKSGVVINAPFEVHLSDDSRPVQPDILFLSDDRKPALGTQVFHRAPDLIVEVVSPSSIRLDRTIKFDRYERAGVAEYWIVDIKTRSIEIHILSGGEYALLGG